MSAAAGNPRQDPVRNVTRRRIRVWVHANNGVVLPGGHFASYTSSFEDGAMTATGNEIDVYEDDLARIRKLVEPDPGKIETAKREFRELRAGFLAMRQAEATTQGSNGAALKWQDIEKDWPMSHPNNWVDLFQRQTTDGANPRGRNPRPILKLEVDDAVLPPPQSAEEIRMQRTVEGLAKAIRSGGDRGGNRG